MQGTSSTRGVLDGKAVVVTGAGGGLGRAYAHHAARQGARVVVNDVNLVNAGRVVEEIRSSGGDAVASGHSVADWSECVEIVELCRGAFGRINGLVNNAAIMSVRSLVDEDEAAIRSIVDVNLIGSMFVAVHAARAMVASGHGGSIVNITSSAQMGIRSLGAYGATKGAIATLTYAWALELAAAGVRVNAYSPVASTPMVATGPALVDVLPSAADNAALVSFLLSERAEGVSGQVIKREGRELIVMSHPSLTPHRSSADTWDLEAVVRLFEPVLRAGRQRVGAPDRG